MDEATDLRDDGFVVRIANRAELDSMLRAVLTATDYGMLLTDLDHVALACNGEFGRLFGIDPSAVVRNDVRAVRKSVASRIVNLKHWMRNLEVVYSDPEAIQIDELELSQPKQTLRRSSMPVRDENGTPIGRLWTFLDVTAEARARRMKDSLIEASRVASVDPREVYQRLVEIVGEFYGSLSILSVRVGDFVEFRAVGGPSEILQGVAGNALSDSYCQFCLGAASPIAIQDASTNPDYENLLPVRAGFTRYAGVPISTPSGHFIGTLCILDARSDEPIGPDDLSFLEQIASKISNELDRESKLQDLRRDLHHADESLRQVQRDLIRSEKLAVTGLLSASIAHDIRNILATIALEIEMRSDDPASAIPVVQQNLDRFAVLAHRLMSYARPAETAQTPVDLCDVIARVLDLLSSHLRVSRIEIKFDRPHQPVSVLGDEHRFEHVFINLFMNAIQAMGRLGELSIRLVAEGDAALVTVTDTGKGLTAPQLAALFQPFASNRVGGFGLGLYSCKCIVDEAGGQISVDSVPNEGTTFSIRLPLLP
jgi:signal transduction histidine kinase